MSLRAAIVRWTARMLLVPVTDAIRWDGIKLQEHVDDDRLAGTLDWDAIDVYEYANPNEHLAGPVDRLHELEDDAEKAYVWVVPSKEAERQLTQMVVGAYREDFGREPDAAHFVVSDLEQLREMDPNTVRIIDPAGGEA